MPYKFETDKVKLTRKEDRRIKLSDKDRETIRKLHFVDGRSIRSIAREYTQVTRRTIQFVLFPERLKSVNYSGKWKKYYDKEVRRKAMKNHRRYKKKVIDSRD